jgi:hypothetical protein
MKSRCALAGNGDRGSHLTQDAVLAALHNPRYHTTAERPEGRL